MKQWKKKFLDFAGISYTHGANNDRIVERMNEKNESSQFDGKVGSLLKEDYTKVLQYLAQ